MTQLSKDYQFQLIYTHANGLSMAWRRSTAMAVSVNTLTVMERTCMNGQKAHMNDGKFHRCSRAA